MICIVSLLSRPGLPFITSIFIACLAQVELSPAYGIHFGKSRLIWSNVDGVTYIENIGFICIIDYEASDYHNLAIAYNLARGLALRKDGKNVEVEFVNMLIKRLLKDIRDVQNIEMLVKTNIKNNQQILKNIEKSLLSIEFNQQYLVKYMEDGALSKADLLDFYQREDIRAKYKLISKEIENPEV